MLAALALPHGLNGDTGSGWPLWSAYSAHFVSAEGRVIDPDRNSMTTSEGQGYAMFFALVADDAPAFERVRSWTENNLAHGNLGGNLPAWSWGQAGGGAWGVLDENSAADADLWIGYSLVEAGRLWRKPAYTASGQGLLRQIADKEVADLPGAGPVLLPGRAELFSTPGHWVVNASYSPLPVLMGAAAAAPEGPWKKMAVALPGWLQRASPSGFAMDWDRDSEGIFAASGNPGDLSHPACGSYDAIRVYLWAGITDQQTPGAKEILQIFAPMARLMKATANPPEMISADGGILSRSAPAGFAAALAPFLASSGDAPGAEALLRRVDAQIDPQSGLVGKPPRYYDQNLALFALGWQEQRFRFAPDGELRVRWKN
jgi:endoglucanase